MDILVLCCLILFFVIRRIGKKRKYKHFQQVDAVFMPYQVEYAYRGWRTDPDSEKYIYVFQYVSDGKNCIATTPKATFKRISFANVGRPCRIVLYPEKGPNGETFCEFLQFLD